MTCQEVVEVLSDYLEGAMPAAERLRLEDHLDRYPGCANYLEQLRTTIRLTGALREETLPAPLPDQLLDAFRAWRAGRPL